MKAWPQIARARTLVCANAWLPFIYRARDKLALRSGFNYSFFKREIHYS
jgi:hypothetical protein